MNSPAARIVQLIFVGIALSVVVAFAVAVRDGERRRAPDALVHYLSPSYTGDNRLAPDFDLMDRQGEHHRLSDLRGKVVVLHFFSRTCEPCVQELQNSIPAFDELLQNRRDIAMLMVSVDSGWQADAPIVPNNVHSPIVFDPERHVVDGKYGTRLFPETWVIDRDGVIRARFDHTLEWDSPIWLNYLTELD